MESIGKPKAGYALRITIFLVGVVCATMYFLQFYAYFKGRLNPPTIYIDNEPPDFSEGIVIPDYNLQKKYKKIQREVKERDKKDFK